MPDLRVKVTVTLDVQVEILGLATTHTMEEDPNG